MNLSAQFPEMHLRVMHDALDPIHRASEFLVESSSNKKLDLRSVNEWLHSSPRYDPWPPFLIAFASNGCGDYFAYNIKHQPPYIIYLDPDCTVEENLTKGDAIHYPTFQAWYESQIQRYTCTMCGSHNVRFQVSQDQACLLRMCSACGFEEHTDEIDA